MSPVAVYLIFAALVPPIWFGIAVLGSVMRNAGRDV